MSAHLFCPRILLAEGWGRNVVVRVDDGGTVSGIRHLGDDGPPEGAERVDGVCVPGVPNVHSHAFQRAMAGLAERRTGHEDSFWGWRERMYHFVGRFGPDELEAVAFLLYVEMLESGYTAVGEFHYLHHRPDGGRYDDPAETSRRVVRAATDAGIGLTHLPVLYLTGGFGGAPPEAGQRRFVWDVDGVVGVAEEVAAAVAEDPDRRAGLALHSLRAVPADALGAAVEAADEALPDAPIHIHVAEQLREVRECRAHTGSRPLELLLDRAPVDHRWCLVHATHAEPHEIREAARRGATVGLCPTTEANLGDGLFPLAGWLEAGGSLAVGSDSHVSVSPVEELRWLEYGQRLRARERNVAARAADAASTGRALLEGVVEGGERVLRRGAGGLATGRRADLVVLDADHPSLADREGDDLLDAWIFASGTPAVRHVMVGGRWVVRDGRHPRRQEALLGYREALRRLG